MVHILSQNVPGRYYIDSKCIHCLLCHTIEPDIFQADHHQGVDYVARQPENDMELALMAEAMGLCPSNAIHDRDEE